MSKKHFTAFFSVFLLVTLSLPSRAQFAQRGGIGGFVFDASSAAVAGAHVTLTDIAHNQTREAVTDASGHFEFNDLSAGDYQLAAVQQGFESAQSETITVSIGRSTRYDFKLKPGSISQSVTVTGETVGLETGQANVDTTVSEKQMAQLPLNGRNFAAIAALAPGVATTPQANINPGGTFAVGATFATGGVAFTTGGVVEGSRDNGFYINGVNITENYESSIGYAPSVEALAEGTIQVADFSAANGHDISALNIQTKGGASKFHGEAYDFLENDAMNAVNPFDKAESLQVLGTPAVKLRFGAISLAEDWAVLSTFRRFLHSSRIEHSSLLTTRILSRVMALSRFLLLCHRQRNAMAISANC